jgi:hypothetical protein
MNFLKYRGAEDLITRTGLSLKDALVAVEAELQRQKQEKN